MEVDEQGAQETFNDALEYAERMMQRNPGRAAANSTPLMKIILSGQNDPRVYREILSGLSSVSNTINEQDPRGATALMYAAESGMGDVALELISFGANKTLKDNNGKTAADLWQAVPNDMFKEPGDKAFFLQKLQGGRRKTRKTRKARKTRRSYVSRKRV